MLALSKRILVFANEVEDFTHVLSEFNKEMSNIPTMPSDLTYPLQKYADLKEGGYKTLKSNPVQFIAAMQVIIPKIVIALQERGTDKRGISKFAQRIAKAVTNLLHKSHEFGLLPFSMVKLWALQVMNETTPGSPYDKHIDQAEKELELSKK